MTRPGTSTQRQTAREICIYSAISGPRQNAPVPRGTGARLRSRLRRIADMAEWRATGRAKFHYYTYTDRYDSNVGDIAIRQAIERTVERQLDREVSFLEVQWEELDDELVDRINGECACFIIGGSGYFQLNPVGEVSRRLSQDLRFLQRLRRPIILFGVGVNFVHVNATGAPVALAPTSVPVVQDILDLAAKISVRDALSKSVLQPLTGKPVELVADPALFLASNATSSTLPGHQRPVIGLNFGFHGPTSTQILQANLAAYIDLCRRLEALHGARFLYFVHSDAERLIPRLLRTARIPVEDVTGSPDDLLGRYAEVDVHICQMLHSSILSLSVGTPTVNMSYDVKNSGFFELMGLAKYSTPALPLNADRVLELCNDLLSRRDEVKVRVFERRRELRRGMHNFAKQVCSLIEEPASLAASGPAPAREHAFLGRMYSTG